MEAIRFNPFITRELQCVATILHTIVCHIATIFEVVAKATFGWVVGWTSGGCRYARTSI